MASGQMHNSRRDKSEVEGVTGSGGSRDTTADMHVHLKRHTTTQDTEQVASMHMQACIMHRYFSTRQTFA